MPVEIERKFLVANDGWRSSVTGSEKLRDGLVGELNGAKVRVRIGQKNATLTVKSHRHGLAAPNIEYEIPMADAEAMLKRFAPGGSLRKPATPLKMPASYGSSMCMRAVSQALFLPKSSWNPKHQAFEMPDWAGREVTNNPRFHKRTMERLCHEEGRPLTIAELLNVPPERLLATG